MINARFQISKLETRNGNRFFFWLGWSRLDIVGSFGVVALAAQLAALVGPGEMRHRNDEEAESKQLIHNSSRSKLEQMGRTDY